MKFDGYIYFFSEVRGGDCVLVLHKKRKKDEKGEKKNQVKVFKRVTTDEHFGSLFPFCTQIRAKLPRPE